MSNAVHIRFGGEDNSVNRNADDYTSVESLIRDPDVKQLLGYGENVKVTRNGIEINLQDAPRAGDIFEVQTRSGTKG